MDYTPSYQELEHQIRKLESQVEALNNTLEFHQVCNKYSNVWETFRDCHGEITYVSPSFELITGFSIDDYISGKISLLDYVYIDDRVNVEVYCQLCSDRKSVHNFECRLLNNHKCILYLSVTSQPVYSSQGEYLGSRTSCVDITQMKTAEVEFGKKEKRFRILTELTSDYSFSQSVNEDGNVPQLDWISEGFVRDFGLSPMEINAGIPWALVYHEDVQMLKDEFSKVMSGEAITCELRVVKRSGEIRWVKTYIHPEIDPLQNRVVRIHGAFQDIHEKKMAEDRLMEWLGYTSAIIRTSPQAIIVSGFDGVVKIWNEAAEQIFGWTSDEAIGTKDSFYSKEQAEELQQVRSQVLAGESIKGYETSFIHKNGHIFCARFSASLLKGSDDKPVGILSMVEDITDWKTAQEELEESEVKYAVLFEESITPISLTKLPEKTFVDVNRAFEKLFGFKKEEVLGKTSMELGLERLDEQTRAVQTFVSTGLVYDNEKYIYTKDGTERIVSTFTSSVRIEDSDFAITTLYDITERKKIELELQHSNERFAKIFEYNPVGCLLIHYITHQVMDINQFALDILGFKRDEVIGKTAIDLNILVDDNDKSISYSVATGGVVKNKEARRRCKDGTIKDVIISAESITIKDEKFVLSVLIDNTARKDAERRLCDALERTSTIIRTSPQAIMVVDTDSRVLQWNASAEHVFGWTEDEAVGNVLPIVPAYKTDELIHIKEQVLRGNVIRSLETIRLDKSGLEIHVNLFVAPLKTDDGSAFGFLVMLEDITTRKKAEEALKINEEKYKNILSSLSDNIVMIDDKYRVQYVNHVSPGNSNKAVVGSNWMLGLKKNVSWRVTNIITDALMKGKSSEIEFQVMDTCHNMKWLQLRSARFYNADVPNVVLIARDITHKKQTEAELASHQEHLEELVLERTTELERLVATKDKFFSIIAHDLKNPFTVLYSSAELLLMLLDKNNVEKAKAKADMILESSRRGCVLLQNLLDWSQSQIGSIKFNPVDVHLNELIAETIALVENQAQDKGIEITNDVPADIEVFADIDLLQIVIRNLITNSIKFTQKGGLINIEAVVEDGYVVVSVIDSGVGMDSETLDRLFRIDTKNTTRGTNEEPGSGLGLILCKEFVEKHGGRIWVESTLGEGSSFKFTIPQKNV